jgi:hypothetical protein
MATESIAIFIAGGATVARGKAQENQITFIQGLVFYGTADAAYNTSTFMTKHSRVITDRNSALLNNNILFLRHIF